MFAVKETKENTVAAASP